MALLLDLLPLNLLSLDPLSFDPDPLSFDLLSHLKSLNPFFLPFWNMTVLLCIFVFFDTGMIFVFVSRIFHGIMELFSYEECWTNSPTNGVGLRARCMPISYGHLLPAPKKWGKNRLGKEDVLWPTESDISRVQMREKGDMECTRRLQ